MKNVLLAVCGISPAVITEALYALEMEGRPVDELVIITTRTGKELVLGRLFPERGGAIRAFLADYGREPDSLAYGEDRLHVLCDRRGRELDDIHTEEDNAILLDACLTLAHQLTSAPATRVYFLVAGGRKTMSACLTLAAQLYGRPDRDKIIHVLVEPPGVEWADFWFPPRQKTRVEWTDRRTGLTSFLSSDRIHIHLVTMPYVPLRALVPENDLARTMTPAELMGLLVREPAPRLALDLAERRAVWGGMQELDRLTAVELAIFAYLAQLRQGCAGRHREGDLCRQCSRSAAEIDAPETGRQLTSLYLRIRNNPCVKEPNPDGIIESFRSTSGVPSNFRTNRSRINKKIRAAVGAHDCHRRAGSDPFSRVLGTHPKLSCSGVLVLDGSGFGRGWSGG
ncbi:MAG: CRISPR-associated ring nuclease Csm6, partial [Thermodesulfobacteriota bacterium]